MSLELIRGEREPDNFGALYNELRRIVEQLVDERIQQNGGSPPRWRWLTTKQAAELLGISPHRIAARVREGKLPGRQYGGRTYVDREELDKAIDRHRVR